MNHLQKAREIMDRIDGMLDGHDRGEVGTTEVLIELTHAQTHASIAQAQATREIAESVSQIASRT